MAYPTDQREMLVVAGANLNGTGVKGRLVAGRYGFVLEGVSVVIETVPADAATLTLQRRPVAGVAANEVTIDTVELTTSHTAGKVVYLDGLDTTIGPGEDVAFNLTGDAASGAATIKAVVRELRDAAANDTSLVATT